MKPEAKKMFHGPRWLMFYISLGMSAAGYCGLGFFENVSRLSHEKINNYDLLAVLCFLLMLTGMAVSLLCCIWIIISAALYYVRRFEAKHSRQH